MPTPSDPAHTNARCMCGRKYFRRGSTYCCAECRAASAPYIPQRMHQLDAASRAIEASLAPIATRHEISELVEAPLPVAPDDARSDLELACALRLLILTLTDKERLVLCMRFGIDKPDEASLAEIGEHLGVCSERARQLVERALSKLRHPSRSKWLATFVDPASDFVTPRVLP